MEWRPVDAVEVVQNFFMEPTQLLIQANRTVTFALGAFLFNGAAGEIPALIILLGLPY